MADDREQGRIGALVERRVEHAPHRRLVAQLAEPVGRHIQRADPVVRILAPHHVVARGRQDGREHVVVFTDELSGGIWNAVRTEVARDAIEADQRREVGNRQRAQDGDVEQLKEAEVQADAGRQDQDRGEGERGGPPQPPGRIASVLPRVVEPRRNPYRPGVLLNERDVAEGAAGGGPGRVPWIRRRPSALPPRARGGRESRDRGHRGDRRRHDCPQAGRSILAIARAICFQRDSSTDSCSRPAGVRR